MSFILWMDEKAPLLLLGAGLVALVRIVQILSRRYLTPVRYLPGPSFKFFFGNSKELMATRASAPREWVEQYGPTMCVRGPLGAPLVYSLDYKLINHILGHSMDYYKPDESRRNLGRILGNGVLVTEGEKHRQQRHIMNPAFGPGQVRELTQIFLEKSAGLCEFWDSKVGPDGTASVNIIEGLSKMTLDVIGLAGFNYAFDALSGKPNALSKAFGEVTKRPPTFNVKQILRSIPPFNLLPDTRMRKAGRAQRVMNEIGMDILQKRKAELLNAGSVEKKDVIGRDLLTLLLKANMAIDIPDHQRLTDEEVLAQIPTFLIAGHETTSTATTWCLFALCKDQAIQAQLREELLTVPTDMPTMEELHALPLLDRIVRETLRLHAPVTTSSRVALHDDVIPLATPVTDRRGRVLHELRVHAGQRFIVPILTLQTSKTIWGEDALEFRPDRWLSPPETIASVPGVWGHLLTFLGGPHACIGYRFSLTEMKALVFTLVRAFEFELAVPLDDVVQFGVFIQRPALRSQIDKGPQLPLRVRPVKRA